ncbi:hypothetical protein GCM10010294_35520 [Streptomyces griseoloalbus]|nr:hypothetical protein GCM10010294_35520 [Streptomyces griseoloalbus]
MSPQHEAPSSSGGREQPSPAGGRDRSSAAGGRGRPAQGGGRRRPSAAQNSPRAADADRGRERATDTGQGQKRTADTGRGQQRTALGQERKDRDKGTDRQGGRRREGRNGGDRDDREPSRSGRALLDREDLRADCASCFGLCCVALPFARSADFAVDKVAGQPCSNLRPDFRCGIHAQLRDKGFPGCTVFDCFGAGQKVSQMTFGGTDWRRAPETSRSMSAVFPVMRQLHELLWYVTEALDLAPARPVHKELRRALTHLDGLTRGTAESITELDMNALRGEVNTLLLRASELARARVPGRKRNHRGADLIGAKLSGADLRGASLRGALLVAADLGGADLRDADVIGADLRDADLSGADLTGALFLTQAQLNAAKGDAATRLPPALSRPAHW